MKTFLLRIFPVLHCYEVRVALSVAALAAAAICSAQSKPAAPAANPAPDVLVLKNGDTLHGKFVNETAGTVKFHSDPLGDVSVSWDNIKEMHVTEKFGVLNKNVKAEHRKKAVPIPEGTLDVADQAITIHPANGPAPPATSTKDAQFIMDAATLSKQINHQPNFFTGWSGPVTAGATLVTATQNQYTVSGAIGLVRVVPTVSWLNPRDRTSIDFSGSFGKITQPAYTNRTTTPPTPVAAVTTKTAIFHADAERDQYFARRVFALVQTAFDHNFSQNLALQQTYGGGLGWTAIKNDRQTLDLKGNIQYEKQQFQSPPASLGSPPPPPPSPSTNLIGSTFAANYMLHMRLVDFTQELSFIPSYNQPHDYSASETNTFAFPAYKSLSFTLGTLDSYLNDAPISEPPTKRNSFQFTMGLTYAIKSKY